MKLDITISNNDVVFYRGVFNSIRDTQLIRILKLDCYADFLLTRKQVEYPLEHYRIFINNLPKESNDIAILTKEDL